MGKKLAIIQSNYIPWKGYFDIINLADEFILYDHVQYTTNDWRNRNLIKTPTGLQWLTIPVRAKYGQTINQTAVNGDIWRRKHWKSLVQNYSKAKYFSIYKDLFEGLYLGSSETRLSQINYQFLTAICAILGIQTRISWSTEYRLMEDRTQRLVDLCKQAGCTEYVSGPSAKGYLDEELFCRDSIVLTYMDYEGYPPYSQLYPPFEHRVSVIDLIFNEGPDSPKFMKSFGIPMPAK
jgi:hypothetical protein